MKKRSSIMPTITVAGLLLAGISIAQSDEKNVAKDLFASGDFSAWTTVKGAPVEKGWKIEDGVVHRYAKGGDIITKESYKDFELSFEWKISKGGNSGVKYRTKGSFGLEYQVLDDQNHPDRKIDNCALSYPAVENATITDSKGNAVETRAGKNQIHFGTKAGETYTLVF